MFGNAHDNSRRKSRRLNTNFAAMFIRHSGVLTGVTSLAIAVLASRWVGLGIRAFVSDGSGSSVSEYILAGVAGATGFASLLVATHVLAYFVMRYRGERLCEQLERH